MKAYLPLVALVLVFSGCIDQRSEEAKSLDRAKEAPAIRDVKDDSMLPGEEAVVAECDDIMRRLHEEGVASAFVKVRALSPLTPPELEKLETMTRDQLAAIEPRFGRIVGFERVRIVKKSDSVIECVYLAKCERHILRWRFYFYRPQEKWFLNSLMWDDKIQEI